MTMYVGDGSSAGMAVVDVETTGLNPRLDRVVEVAVVTVTDDCRPDIEYATLVKPPRHVGATEIHGLTAKDLHEAPTFADIAGDLVELLAGRALVAHNASFEVRFLAAEFDRLGVALPVVPPVCTMRLAGDYLSPLPARTLGSCCATAGVAHDGVHHALGDARAAAALLRVYVERSADRPPHWWRHAAAQSGGAVWPSLSPSRVRPFTRDTVSLVRTWQETYLGRLVASMPPVDDVSVEVDAYLAVLDRALEDRYLSLAEAEQLRAVAVELGVDWQEMEGAHVRYLDAIARTAVADGVVTEDEMADLRQVARLLGLPLEAVDRALEAARVPDVAVSTDGWRPADRTLAPGMAICFTGDMDGRPELEEAARRAGLRVTSAVSGRTAYLVAHDAMSQSGKARRAAEVGTPVISPTVFRTMLATMG